MMEKGREIHAFLIWFSLLRRELRSRFLAKKMIYFIGKRRLWCSFVCCEISSHTLPPSIQSVGVVWLCKNRISCEAGKPIIPAFFSPSLSSSREKTTSKDFGNRHCKKWKSILDPINHGGRYHIGKFAAVAAAAPPNSKKSGFPHKSWPSNELAALENDSSILNHLIMKWTTVRAATATKWSNQLFSRVNTLSIAAGKKGRKHVFRSIFVIHIHDSSGSTRNYFF